MFIGSVKSGYAISLRGRRGREGRGRRKDKKGKEKR